MTLIRCPWPATEQRPNFIRSNHWTKWRKIGSQYQQACWALACEQNVHKANWPDGDISLEYTFYAPKGCRWDDDNKEGAFKKGQDGIALAMGVDDKRFRASKKHVRDADQPCVLVRIITQSVVRVDVAGVIS